MLRLNLTKVFSFLIYNAGNYTITILRGHSGGGRSQFYVTWPKYRKSISLSSKCLHKKVRAKESFQKTARS